MVRIAIDGSNRLWLDDADVAGTLSIVDKIEPGLYFVPFDDLAGDRNEVQRVHDLIVCMVWIAKGTEEMIEHLFEDLAPYKGR